MPNKAVHIIFSVVIHKGINCKNDPLNVLFLCRSLLRADAERGAGRFIPRAFGPGQYWRVVTSSKWMKAMFFSKKVARFVSVYLLWKKSCQKGLKVAKYSAKVTLVTWELMAEGGWYWGSSPQINQRMGNTGYFLWECRPFFEHTERAVRNA